MKSRDVGIDENEGEEEEQEQKTVMDRRWKEKSIEQERNKRKEKGQKGR